MTTLTASSRWARLQLNLRKALGERETIAKSETCTTATDFAIEQFDRLVDRILDDLSALDQDGEIGDSKTLSLAAERGAN